MVIAHHFILTGYGHWLPNDPRGSLSKEIAAGKLIPLGDIHYGRKSIQPPRTELREFHRQAAPLLEHPVIWFDAAMRKIIADAFGSVVHDCGYTCWACAIMSNHAHLVIRRHRDTAENMMERLRATSIRQLRLLDHIPAEHPVWSNDRFKKFLSNADELTTRIRYVEDNPIKAGEARQEYDFVRTYRGVRSGRAM